MPVCNGCGVNRETSREHLIHRKIGEALLGRRGHEDTDAMRRELLTGYVSFRGEPGNATHDAVRMDGVITNLLCVECNSGWANDLESAAGDNLFAFLHNGKPLDVHQFHRWFVFFMFKARMYYTRSEPLAEGPLVDLFSKVRDPSNQPVIRVFGARLEADPTVWQFTFHEAPVGGPVVSGFMLVTRGVLWFMPFGSEPLPLDAAPVADTLTLSDLPALRPARLAGVIVPTEAIDALGERVKRQGNPPG